MVKRNKKSQRRRPSGFCKGLRGLLENIGQPGGQGAMQMGQGGSCSCSDPSGGHR